MLFRVELFSAVALAQYDYANLASFAQRTYEYSDGDYASLGFPSVGSGDDAGLGFGFYENSYDATGDDSYDAPLFDFPDEDASFDDMMESLEQITTTEISTEILTTTEQSTTTADNRLRLDRRQRPIPPVFIPAEAVTENIIVEKPAELAVSNSAVESIFVPSARAIGIYGSCLVCDGESPAACKTRNDVKTCSGRDDTCLVQIRTRSPNSDHMIFSRCAPLDVCKNQEAQNFIGPDARYFQCRSNSAERWSRASSCTLCHKMGTDSLKLLFSTPLSVEIDSSGNVLLLSLIMSSPQTYLDENKPTNYVYGTQNWY